jgi:peptidyl-prolyl cis-trans isomerase D
VRWFAISDSTVKISDSDIKKYYNDNEKNFKQEESRDIEYITFEIAPTEADKQATLEAIEKMKIDFSKPEVDAVQFVNLNSDEPFLGLNQKASEFNFGIEGFLANAVVNEVYGPYFEEESYKVSRVVAINQVPDSVKARHILIRQNSLEASNSTADSILNLINKGANFDELARKHSIDQGSALNGGDLGWFTEGRMVKPFNDACFSAKKDDVVKVESQFGIHIINVLELSKTTTKYQLATLARKVTYSSKTYQEIYSNTTKFAALNNSPEKFNKAVTDQNLTKRFGRGLKKNDNNVANLESSRELVRWAFESKVNSLSPVFEFGSQFVVALLTNSNEEGVMSLEMAKPQIERELMNNKKADVIIERFNNAISGESSLSSVAQKMNTTVQNAQNISFGSPQVPGAGVEPALVSLAVNTPANQISKPIKGNNGVFVVKVNKINNVGVQEEMVRQEIARTIDMSIDYQLIEALKENAEITDNRSSFY